MIKTKLLSIAVFIFPMLCSAQGILTNHTNNVSPTCGSYHLMTSIDKEQDNLLQLSNELLEKVSTKIQTKSTLSDYDNRYIIPVVFHVVYNNEEENIPDSVLFNQIDLLNKCFRRQNADTINTREIFQDIVADAQIEFRLAETTPEGLPTNGITRTSTDISHFGGTLPYNQNQTNEIIQWLDDNLMQNYYRITQNSTGGIDPWDTNKYLNVWIGDMRIFEPELENFEELFYMALASPPIDHENWPNEVIEELGLLEQGILIHYVNVGSNNANQFPEPYTIFEGLTNTGKLLVHEVGHYLGLRHIWGDGNCSYDDFISDTPKANAASNYTCNLSTNSCFDSSNGNPPDMVENYMDYSSGDCQNSFTVEQIDVMREVLSVFRTELPELLPLSIEKAFITSTISLYPNPTNGHFRINLEKEAKTLDLKIINNIGQSVIQSHYENINQLDLSLDLKPGLYFIQAEIDRSNFSTTKLIINNQ